MTITLDYINSYETAKVIRDARQASLDAASNEMKKFDHLRLPNGLTPDAVKALPEYQCAKIASEFAFAGLREINGYINKHFKKERKAERKRPMS